MNTLNKLAGALDAFGSAVRVAAAHRAGRSPQARDLRRLGIDPKAFASIHQI